jgi:oligopeptide/dipeptide ABC transporter ATP-binding protein
MSPPPLLEAEGLVKEFGHRGGAARRSARRVLRAVDGASLVVQAGQALGIVGESACGKTTLGRLLVGLHEPDAGRIRWQGHELNSLPAAERRAASRQMQMVFQDPNASLNPRKTMRQILEAPLRWHGLGNTAQRAARVRELLDCVNLDVEALDLHPHQFSGGQRQRIGIARALATAPRLLVLDEPTSALDVSVQAQVLNLLATLRQSLQLALVLISHDLGTVRWLCDRVAVMYMGRVVESGAVQEVFGRPQHPYTQALLAAVPSGVPGALRQRWPLAGELQRPAGGCAFAPRFPRAIAACGKDSPALRSAGRAGADHLAACIRLSALETTPRKEIT